MTTPEQIRERVEMLDKVCRPIDHATDWLRSAFLTCRSQQDKLLADHRELRELFIAATALRTLTVREAQLCSVCRICKKSYRDSGGGDFLLNYGKEFAHHYCLEKSQ